jgi:hypothetical protein
MNKTLLAVLALCGFACGAKVQSLPDGGRERENCTTQSAALVVKVVDAQAHGVEGAAVTAKNVGSGKTVTATTDGQGGTQAVTEAIGSGTVRLSATSGPLVSQTAQVEFVCGDCACTVEPKSVTLQLQ